MAGKEPFFEDQPDFDLPFIFPWSAGKRLFPPGGIPALICVDPDDGTGRYYPHNTPATGGNRFNP